ncbi:hypothetical protein KY331_01930 [Candidatus Woesearchaeota archaeon]|nr:hypothetical protein [Candidatus Woesearchaeota archaeon]
MDILYYFLPGILILGIITSLSDIRYGKIRNKWIIFALIYGLVVNLTLIFYYLYFGNLSLGYVSELFVNMGFGLLVGFGFWWMKVWTAGDGKLFFAYSVLIPLTAYRHGYIKWTPSFMLLINIFIPSLLAMVFLMLFRVKIENIKKVMKSFLKEFFQLKSLLNTVVYLFAIFWIIQILLSFVGIQNYILRIFLTVFVFSKIKKKLNKSFYIMLGIVLLRLVIDKSVYSFSFLIDLLVLVFVWKFFRSFLKGSLSKLGEEIFAKEIKIDKLKPGMILSEKLQKASKDELKSLKKKDMKAIKYKGDYYIKKQKSKFELDDFIEEEAEGLTKKQINKLKEIGVKKIKISQTIPFAPFMFFGVLLTLIVKGNILILVDFLI